MDKRNERHEMFEYSVIIEGKKATRAKDGWTSDKSCWPGGYDVSTGSDGPGKKALAHQV